MMFSRRRSGGDVDISGLQRRMAALQTAVQLGGDRLEPGPAEAARRLVDKAAARLALTGDRTVAALAGATGSGKSSLFNAIAGAPLSQVGIRRPTTSVASAVLWPQPADRGGQAGQGSDPSALLQWLQVPTWHQVPPDRADPALDGLVLLDLPDHDSTEAANRAEAERLIELVDAFCWVTDPQKYADAVLHRRYLQPLAGHDAVTIVVLNQADRLTPDQLQACLTDLTALLRADGLPHATVLPVSAVTGAGLDRLREALGTVVSSRTATLQRLSADVRVAARELVGGDGAPSARGQAAKQPDVAKVAADAGFTRALGNAAGVPTVLAAVEAGYRRDATGAVGWPFTRWLRRFRPDPLRRLRLGPGGQLAGVLGAGGQRAPRDGSNASDTAVTPARSSLPPPTEAALAELELAGRRVGDAAAAGLPPRWAGAVQQAARPPQSDVLDGLDRVVAGTDLGLRRPLWWRLIGLLQWLFAGAAVAGLVWLLVLMVLGWLKVPQPETPYLGPLPWPTVLLAGGALAGLLTAAICRPLIGIGARRRRDRAERTLQQRLDGFAQQRVLAPVATVLEDYREITAALAVAAG